MFEIVVDERWIAGFLLALTRCVAWVVTCPPFGTRSLPTTVKVGLAAALTVSLGDRLPELAVPLEPGPLLLGALLQAFTGVAMGFVGILLFSAFQAAGAFVDLFGGLAVAQLYDPLTSNTTSIFGRFYQLLATVLLFAIGGHLLLVQGFLTSFEAAPFGLASGVDGAMADGLVRSLGLFFLASLEVVAPLLAALFLADVAMGLLARSAPDLNVFLLGLPAKLLLTLSIAGLTMPLLPGAVRTLTETAVRAFGAMGT